MSVWGREVNQDVRGTWLNNLLYNIHLLVGKVASPGNSPFATTGQPSGGSAVHDAGTLTQTLPRGVVQNEADRRRAAEIWGVPVERIDGPADRACRCRCSASSRRGDIRFLWIMATDPMVSLPNLDRYRRAAAKDDRFIVVSEAYPTPTTDVADVVLPAAMWLEREGIYANVERRAQYFERMVAPPGDATERRLAADRGRAPPRLRAALPVRAGPSRGAGLGGVRPVPCRATRARCRPSPRCARSRA